MSSSSRESLVNLYLSVQPQPSVSSHVIAQTQHSRAGSDAGDNGSAKIYASSDSCDSFQIVTLLWFRVGKDEQSSHI